MPMSVSMASRTASSQPDWMVQGAAKASRSMARGNGGTGPHWKLDPNGATGGALSPPPSPSSTTSSAAAAATSSPKCCHAGSRHRGVPVASAARNRFKGSSPRPGRSLHDDEFRRVLALQPPRSASVFRVPPAPPKALQLTTPSSSGLLAGGSAGTPWVTARSPATAAGWTSFVAAGPRRGRLKHGSSNLQGTASAPRGNHSRFSPTTGSPTGRAAA
mmetsp:Transcript_50682/g.127699  ORF Transcript_50682/g.127699 Transcript_50682/m.127699 type:complete len:217 (+) Transcript_50682:202-852(+)